MKNFLNNASSIYLDTNIFVYYFNDQSVFYPKADLLLRELTTRDTPLLTSMITVTELLSFAASDKYISFLQEALLSMPQLSLVELDLATAQKAAQIRRTYRFSLPDALHLATAHISKADVFITNDRRLTSYKDLKVLLLEELE